jgi:hypothetical protein
MKNMSDDDIKRQIDAAKAFMPGISQRKIKWRWYRDAKHNTWDDEIRFIVHRVDVSWLDIVYHQQI